MNDIENFNITKNYRNVYYKYYNLKKKWLINNANIWFNRTCLQQNIIPNYAKSKNKPYNNISKQTNIQYSNIRMKNENQYLFRKKNFQNLQLYNIEMQAYKLYNNFWPTIKLAMLEKLSKFVKQKYQNLNKKLVVLRNQQNNNKYKVKSNQNSFQFQQPVKNLTETKFTKEEIDHIALGYKSNFHKMNKSSISNLVIESENIIQHRDTLNKQEIRVHINQQIKNNINKKLTNQKSNNVFSNKTFQNVIKKVKDNNLTINNADKGNIITIENKDKQKQKIKTFLNNSIYKKLNSDPTKKYQKEIKDVLKQSKNIFNNTYHLINPNPSAPRFRSSTKIHKQSNPIGPIVNYKLAPAYNVKNTLLKYYIQNLIYNTNII